jgi:hypothetical protein
MLNIIEEMAPFIFFKVYQPQSVLKDVTTTDKAQWPFDGKYLPFTGFIVVGVLMSCNFDGETVVS